RRQPIHGQEGEERICVTVRLILDPASEYGGWHRGEALEHTDPTAYRSKMLAAEEVADQGPGHGVDAISEREQDNKEDHVPESTTTEQQHTKTQAAQEDTCGANLLFGPAMAYPPRERTENDTTEGHESHKEGGSGLVKPFPDQEWDEVHSNPGIGNIT